MMSMFPPIDPEQFERDQQTQMEMNRHVLVNICGYPEKALKWLINAIVTYDDSKLDQIFSPDSFHFPGPSHVVTLIFARPHSDNIRSYRVFKGSSLKSLELTEQYEEKRTNNNSYRSRYKPVNRPYKQLFEPIPPHLSKFGEIGKATVYIHMQKFNCLFFSDILCGKPAYRIQGKQVDFPHNQFGAMLPVENTQHKYFRPDQYWRVMLSKLGVIMQNEGSL